MDASIWPVLACVLGLMLMVAEVFLPTSGLLGVPAAGFLIISVYLAFLGSNERGFRFLIAESVMVPATLGGSVYLFSRMMVRGGRMKLLPPMEEDREVAHGVRDLDLLIGRPGRALTPLRPSGMVDFDGRRLEGVSQEGLIAVGMAVFAVEVRSGRLVVREAQAIPDAPTSSEDG